jgi:hypothetical protein
VGLYYPVNYSPSAKLKKPTTFQECACGREGGWFFALYHLWRRIQGNNHLRNPITTVSTSNSAIKGGYRFQVELIRRWLAQGHS